MACDHELWFYIQFIVPAKDNDIFSMCLDLAAKINTVSMLIAT